MDVVLLADKSGVLQCPPTGQRVGASHQGGAARPTRIQRTGNRSHDLTWLYQITSYLMECLAVRGAEEEGEGRLQSPCRSSMERLQGESREEASPVPSGCSPSNLHQQTQ